MDPLTALFAHATPTARTFFTGNLCQTAQFTSVGHLHLLKAGALRVTQDGGADLELVEPTLLFLPRGRAHAFAVVPERWASPVSATAAPRGPEGTPPPPPLPQS